MLEIFHNFEEIAGRLAPSILIGSAIVLLLLGLGMWVVGLALRKILISMAGLAGGIFVGVFVVGRNAFSASLSAALAALIAMILEKILAVLLAAALAAALAFVVFSAPYFETEVRNVMPERTTKASLDESLYEIKMFGRDAGGKIKQAGEKIPAHIWVIITAPAAISLIFGAAVWRYTIALFFSVLGTMVVSLGVMLLLSYKGTDFVSLIRSRPLISAAVFLAMAASGTIAQLLLCKSSKKQKVTEIKPREKQDKDKQEPEEIVEQDWRSA
ncbi:MAG: hypothetical protein ACYS7Y_23415 [Planctomycetota bacterium]|jgi:hypothetical protein